MKIGLFGGTFDPPHNAHIIIAKLALKKFALNKIFFIVSKIPPHKSPCTITPFFDRFNMVKRAIRNIKNFEISDYEMSRNGPSYSYYTIKHFTKLYQGAQLYFLIGHDEFLTLPQWFRIKNIAKMIEFIVVPRKCSYPCSRSSVENFKGTIHFLQIKPINISSTMIRENIWRKKSVLKLIPKTVACYIKKKLL
ncbi:MAG: nicotinate (nicotinamide) nucleotide adenylyltransferase, partial [Planctomycetota bacterium]